jgi:hypothetical protein
LISLDLARDALGLGWPDDTRDLQLETQHIPAAINYAENRYGLTLLRSTWEYVRRGWPDRCDPIELPRPPTICVTEFVHSTDCGDWVRVAETDFRLQQSGTGMLIYPCDCWPRTNCLCNVCSGCQQKIRITYEAGYEQWGDVPANLREGLIRFIEFLMFSNDNARQISDMLMSQESNMRAVGHYG